MADLLQRSRLLWTALAIALGLTVLATTANPLLSDALAAILPRTNEILIALTENGDGECFDTVRVQGNSILLIFP